MPREQLKTTNQTQADAKPKRPIVDADAHIEPPYEMWQEYLPTKLAELAPYIEHGEEHDWIVFEGKKRPVTMISNQAGRKGEDFKMVGRRSEMRPVWLPETRLDDMTTDGMDAAILFGGGPLGTANADLYIASFDAYNRWVWDFCGADRQRLLPVGYVPMRDVHETVSMLHTLAQRGFTAVNIPAFPMDRDVPKAGGFNTQALGISGNPNGDRSYIDAEFDLLWETASELDLTLTMHLGGRVPRFGNAQHFLPDLVMSKTAMAEPVAILTYGAIFQRFPKLRLAIVESGVGWLAWMAEYMDRTWERQRFWTKSPLRDKPSHFLDQNVYASFIHDRTGVLNRNLPGGRNIMWSSDYPHSETTFPHSLQVIERDFDGIPEADIHQIVCARAKRLYRLGV